MVTLAPLTTKPVSAVLTAQPTPLLWSPRQIHRSSPITLLLLICRQRAALPTADPPTRKKRSLSDVGLAAWPALEPSWPTCSRMGELVAPAAKRMTAILTPS